MSKPALGRGLASLLQEETDRGAVKAPGLTSWKGPEQPGATTSATSASETIPAAMPGDASAALQQESQTPVSTPATPQAVAEVPVPAIPGPPVSVPGTTLLQDVPASASPLPAQTSGHPVANAATSAAILPSAATQAAGPQVATVPSAAGPAVPGWIIPALVAGDLVVVLSGILWAAWGRGWGRWPWIAALFAVGCTQAIAALFISRSGQRPASGPLAGRPPAGSAPAPGIRVRFVEEQPQSRRGDRR